jgi:hypothetical protein
VIVLSLDISSSSGWAVTSDPILTGMLPSLIAYGTIGLTKRVKDYGDKKYPWAIYHGAAAMGDFIISKIQDIHPDVVVIECINKARARMSQQFLDFIHCYVQSYLDKHREFELFYIDSSEWRRVSGSVMSKDGKKANAKLSAAKRKLKSGQKLDRKKLGIKGKITKKHVAVARANELFSLTLKLVDNDIADAILQNYAYRMGAKPTQLE